MISSPARPVRGRFRADARFCRVEGGPEHSSGVTLRELDQGSSCGRTDAGDGVVVQLLGGFEGVSVVHEVAGEDLEGISREPATTDRPGHSPRRGSRWDPRPRAGLLLPRPGTSKRRRGRGRRRTCRRPGRPARTGTRDRVSRMRQHAACSGPDGRGAGVEVEGWSWSVMGVTAGWIAPNTGPKSGAVFVLVCMTVVLPVTGVISAASRGRRR